MLENGSYSQERLQFRERSSLGSPAILALLLRLVNMSVSWKTRQVLRLTNDLIEAARAKALAEVLVAKAQGEAQAAKAEVQAAKAEAQAAKAETQIVKAQGEAQAAKARGEAKDLLHSLQWRTVALAQLRGKLNMRGLLGE